MPTWILKSSIPGIFHGKNPAENSLDHMISEADYEYLKRCLLRDERYTYYFSHPFHGGNRRPGQRGDSVQAEDIFSGYRTSIPKEIKSGASTSHSHSEPIPSNGFPFSTNPTVPSSSTASGFPHLSRRHPQPAQNHRPLLPHDTGNGYIRMHSATGLPRVLSKNAAIFPCWRIC